MPEDRSNEQGDDCHHERHGKRRSRHHRSQRHDESQSSNLIQESEDMYGPPPAMRSYSPQTIPADRTFTLSPVSQGIQDRRIFRKRHPRSASSPVRQKYVYPPQEISQSATSSSPTKGSNRRRYSIRNSRHDTDADLDRTEEDADNHARPREQARPRPEASDDGHEQRAPTTPEQSKRRPRPIHPPTSYPSGGHRYSPKKPEFYPPSLPSTVDVKDFAHDSPHRSRTRRGSYSESREDLTTLSPSEHTQTARTEATTDLSQTEAGTGYLTSRTVSTTGQSQPREQQDRHSAEHNYPAEFPAGSHTGRSARREPDDTDQSEIITSVTTDRNSALNSATYHHFQERFADLCYICPEDFRKELKTWEEYAATSHQDVSPSNWFYAQRKIVMCRFLWLTEFFEDRYRPPEA